MKTGLQILQNRNVKYDSSKSHLLIDGDKLVGHFKIVTIDAAPISAPSNGIDFTQTVLTIPHGLTYTPFVDCYFFPAATTPDTSSFYKLTDTYYHNFFSYINLGSPITSGLTVKVDTVNLKVIHTFNTTAAPTSDVPFPVKMKYIVFSQEGYLMP